MSESDGRGDETEQPQSNTVLYLPLFLPDICVDGQKLPEVTIGSISLIPDSKKLTCAIVHYGHQLWPPVMAMSTCDYRHLLLPQATVQKELSFN